MGGGGRDRESKVGSVGKEKFVSAGTEKSSTK